MEVWTAQVWQLRSCSIFTKMFVQRISQWPTTLHPSSMSPTLWSRVPTPQEHFLKDSVQMECEELFPSSLSFSHPSSIRPPPPPLRVLPNEALRSSMWVSYSESQQPRVPIWKLVTLSAPLCAADLTLSLSQMLSQTDPTCRHIQTHTAKSSSTPTLPVSSLQLFKETNSWSLYIVFPCMLQIITFWVISGNVPSNFAWITGIHCNVTMW